MVAEVVVVVVIVLGVLGVMVGGLGWVSIRSVVFFGEVFFLGGEGEGERG